MKMHSVRRCVWWGVFLVLCGLLAGEVSHASRHVLDTSDPDWGPSPKVCGCASAVLCLEGGVVSYCVHGYVLM
jgi:hypothetical protein